MTEDENTAGAEGVRVPREPDPDELRKAARARALKHVAVGALVAGLLLLLAFQAWNVIMIRETQVANRTTLTQAKSAATSAKATADRIEDCTSPGGDCFERAQRQTSGAVAGINTITVRATACLAVVLKGIPDGTNVVVDEVASAIQQCIRTSSTSVQPQRVVPAPESSVRPKADTSPKGHGPRGPTPRPPSTTSPPASPGPTATPAPTSLDVTDVLCRLLAVPLICS